MALFFSSRQTLKQLQSGLNRLREEVRLLNSNVAQTLFRDPDPLLRGLEDLTVSVRVLQERIDALEKTVRDLDTHSAAGDRLQEGIDHILCYSGPKGGGRA